MKSAQGDPIPKNVIEGPQEPVTDCHIEIEALQWGLEQQTSGRGLRRRRRSALTKTSAECDDNLATGADITATLGDTRRQKLGSRTETVGCTDPRWCRQSLTEQLTEVTTNETFTAISDLATKHVTCADRRLKMGLKAAEGSKTTTRGDTTRQNEKNDYTFAVFGGTLLSAHGIAGQRQLRFRGGENSVPQTGEGLPCHRLCRRLPEVGGSWLRSPLNAHRQVRGLLNNCLPKPP